MTQIDRDDTISIQEYWNYSNKYTAYAQECGKKYEHDEARNRRYKHDPNEASKNEKKHITKTKNTMNEISRGPDTTKERSVNLELEQ